MTNGAKRTRSRRGSRARMKTPSGFVAALLDRGAERVELCEPRAVLVGNEQAHLLETLGEVLRDPLAQLVEPLAGERGDLERLAENGSTAAAGQADRAGRPC